MCGKLVHKFEERVSDLFAKHVGLMVNSGSSANTLAVALLDLPRGSEVITPALNWATTVAPIVQHGLVPVFVDVEPDTYTIDATKAEERIGPQTRAIIVPDLIGNLADWVVLRKIADEHGLVVIEDSCDTLGSLFRGKSPGVYSHIVTTSFYGSHIITCAGFGGMICLDDESLEKRGRLLRGWGRRSTLRGVTKDFAGRFDSLVDGIPYDDNYVFDAIGYNFLPSEIGAAFGLVQLDRLETFIELRLRNFAELVKFFAQYEELFILPRQRPDTRTAWLAFPLVVRDSAPFTRTDLQIYFEQNGIQTRTVFAGNVLRQPGFKDIPRRDDPRGYPHADQITRGG